MSIKTYIIKVLSWSGKRKRRKRAREFLKDESLSDEGMVARIKNYPPEIIGPDHPKYHDFD
jgi:hypothetical protein